MRTIVSVVFRAVVMVIVFGSIGILSNVLSGKPVGWIYIPTEERLLAGVKVQLIDAKAARRYFDYSGTIFIDSRDCRDYAKSHVKGAICLPPDDLEQRFPTVEPLIPPESRVILYCYGPDCDMAERVGTFLAQRGYENMMIMSSGLPGWEKAEFPVNGRSKEDAAIEDPEEIWGEHAVADTEIASRRFCRCRDPLKVAWDPSAFRVEIVS